MVWRRAGGGIARVGRAFLLVLCLTAAVAGAEDVAATIARATELGASHRFQEALELLSPLVGTQLDSETEYIVSAEVGRAYFHLGQYEPAHVAFRRAVTLRPRRIETALYLEATSYLVGDRAQAYTILSEVLRSGARDLYLAVTLPGERAFLADPEVWKIIEGSSVPLQIDPRQSAVLGVHLGDAHDVVAQLLGAAPTAEEGPVLAARAGPVPLWVFSFDDEGTLREVLIHAEHVLRYTPYRLRIGEDLDWRATPAQATLALGPSARSGSDADDELVLSWDFEACTVSLVFGQPVTPRPPVLDEAAATLKVVRLTRR